ncbi:Domain of Uncharacterised Function (DUF1080) [Sphingobacterium spiritivorum]|uniref:Domain of Uncharacterized Function (DUF1080) n=1 Tax=Sphingobacterium spiritivorum TaxID=258 RepID=A0A380CPC5_SPHSI|nr:DUF1080 domain-containing protein [Sphingobacterium spiritivorum]SUJ24142.1 Domain of Uncharacterised Function (DUF1080) [Sphingobacterium spiritivorum]
MKKYPVLLSICCLTLSLPSAFSQTQFKPEDTEYYSPKPRIVTSSNGIPADAVILFNGKDLSQWQSEGKPGSTAAWTVEDNILTVKPSSGNIQTKEKFNDFQLHIEWRSPLTVKGKGQGRGNSGIFLQGLYEIQVLDNNDNPTYVNGQAGSIYKQRPPLVESRVDAGQWHIYDIIYTAPRFNIDGMLISKARVTVLHNGILVQNNTEIEGTTEYIGLPKLKAHGAGPIVLQDHGDLVSYRNIWIRNL